MSSFGTLYIVATPIGNLEDFSARAIATLQRVDYIAAEDTRHSRRLLDHFNINTTCLSLHEHNESQRAQQLLQYLQQGKSVALISDAGTPLISDPGFRLIQMVRSQHIQISPIPGPCAVTTALSVAGLPSDRFVFEGFLPPKTSARQKQLQSLKDETRTLVFYESPHRVLDTIDDMMLIFGEQRYIIVARELTKLFETVHGDTLLAVKNWLVTDPMQQKGEFVLLVHGAEAPNHNEMLSSENLRLLEILLTELPISQAVKLATKITGAKKSQLYKIALERQNT